MAGLENIKHDKKNLILCFLALFTDYAQNNVPIQYVHQYISYIWASHARSNNSKFTGITKYKSETHWIYKLTDYWQYPGNRELFYLVHTADWISVHFINTTCDLLTPINRFGLLFTFGKCTQNTHIARLNPVVFHFGDSYSEDKYGMTSL